MEFVGQALVCRRATSPFKSRCLAPTETSVLTRRLPSVLAACWNEPCISRAPAQGRAAIVAELGLTCQGLMDTSLNQFLRHFPDFANSSPIAISHRHTEQFLGICSELGSA